MSRKLYIFGIGGTGSRVIKNFTMLLASGVKLSNDFDMVIPIIIDPDVSNGDLNRTKNILRLYQEIRNEIHEPINFFSQKVSTINELKTENKTISPEYFHFKLDDVEDTTFGDYIGFSQLSKNFKEGKDDRNFVKLLYSDKNLNAKLNVGFKGNPNMGSIVLDQFTNSENFNNFAGTFSDNDAIFIVNSIFGGTGAAGYPLLLKNLRGNKELARHEKISAAKIGALTMLPYFALNAEDEINAESFEHKAIAAIDYYNRTIIDKNEVDYQYFIGNSGNTNFEEYSVGGETQKNKAHFLELAGALSILDFCKSIPVTVEVENADRTTQVREFGVEKFTDSVITFNHLSEDNRKQCAKEITKYKLFTDYLKRRLPRVLGKTRWTKGKFFGGRKKDYSILDKKYFNSTDYKNQILAFNNYFDEWLEEMQNNIPSFSPFNDVEMDDALTLVKGNKPTRVKGYEEIDIVNNELITNKNIRNTNNKKHSTLIKLFDSSIEKVLKEYKVLQNNTQQ